MSIPEHQHTETAGLLFFVEKEQDEKIFEQVFRQFFVPLCAWCSARYNLDTEQARDVVHASFMRLWEARRRISPALPVKSYLYRIVENACVDFIRNHHVRLKYEKNISIITPGEYWYTQADHTEWKELAAKIEAAVNELPAQMQEVFRLCRYDGRSHAEIAAQLRISVRTVETHMSKALLRLRAKLAAYISQ